MNLQKKIIISVLTVLSLLTGVFIWFYGLANEEAAKQSPEFGEIHAWLYFFQALFGIANVVALFLLKTQVKSSHDQIESTRQQAEKDFIVSVGRHSDEIYDSLCVSKEVIDRVYTAEIEAIKKGLQKTKWEAADTHEFWYCRRLFAHVARMAAIVGEKVEAGRVSSKTEVDRYFESWVEELRLRILDSDIMLWIAKQAVSDEGKNWNGHIRQKVGSILESLPAAKIHQRDDGGKAPDIK